MNAMTRVWYTLAVPVGAIILGIVVGGLIILLSSPFVTGSFDLALPFVAYAALLAVAFFLQRYPATSLFVIGGTTLLLLFVGIHNAWDSVVYIAIEGQRRAQMREERK